MTANFSNPISAGAQTSIKAFYHDFVNYMVENYSTTPGQLMLDWNCVGAIASASRSATSPTKTASPSPPTKSPAAASPASASDTISQRSNNPLTNAPTRLTLAGALYVS